MTLRNRSTDIYFFNMALDTNIRILDEVSITSDNIWHHGLDAIRSTITPYLEKQATCI